MNTHTAPAEAIPAKTCHHFAGTAAAALTNMAPTDAAAVVILGRDGLRTLLTQNTDARTELRMAAELIIGAMDPNRPGAGGVHPHALALAARLLPRPDQPDPPPPPPALAPRAFVLCWRESADAPVQFASCPRTADHAQAMVGMLNATAPTGTQFWFAPIDLVEGAR